MRGAVRSALVVFALAFTAVLNFGGTAWAQSPVMPTSEAVSDTDATLSWRFKNAYDHAAGYAPIRCSRNSSISFRCSVGWAIGDTEFFGQVVPYYSSQAPDGTVYWNANYKITRLNDYCAFVKHLPKRRCVRHYRGTY